MQKLTLAAAAFLAWFPDWLLPLAEYVGTWN